MLGDPVNLVDPEGLNPVTPFAGAIVGGLVGGVVGGIGSLWNGGSWDGNPIQGAIIGMIGGAAAGFCAGMGNLSGASAAWDAVGVGADIIINASQGAIGSSGD